ncbi:MAG: hypothetical protein HA494_09365 [Thaumarchaeota archaeon]|nr:hypothetical protein [Nitrososphaerota archaeon]
MVKLQDLEEYLTPEDVKDDVVTFLDEGVYKKAEETPFGRPVFQISVKLPDGRVKIATLNRTSRKELAKAYGEDTKNWVGREARVTKVKQNVRGELKDVIYFHPTQTLLKPPAQPELTCQLCGAKISGANEQEAREELREHVAKGCG